MHEAYGAYDDDKHLDNHDYDDDTDADTDNHTGDDTDDDINTHIIVWSGYPAGHPASMRPGLGKGETGAPVLPAPEPWLYIDKYVCSIWYSC